MSAFLGSVNLGTRHPVQASVLLISHVGVILLVLQIGFLDSKYNNVKKALPNAELDGAEDLPSLQPFKVIPILAAVLLASLKGWEMGQEEDQAVFFSWKEQGPWDRPGRQLTWSEHSADRDQPYTCASDLGVYWTRKAPDTRCGL